MKKIKSLFGFNKSLGLLIPFLIFAIIFIIVPLILILVKALTPTTDGTLADNWFSVGETTANKILKSFLISIVATFACLLIGFPFAYFVARSKSKVFIACAVVLITGPIWSSLLIKLIGLKVTFLFAFTNGEELANQVWTTLGIVYVYLPFMILPLITSLKDLPENLLEASRDLGRKRIYTFFSVVVPWTRVALTSGILLVFLPAFTSVAIPQFLDHSSSGQMIGNIVYNYGEKGFIGELSLANASSLSIVISAIMFAFYLIIVLTPKIYTYFSKRKIVVLSNTNQALGAKK